MKVSDLSTKMQFSHSRIVHNSGKIYTPSVQVSGLSTRMQFYHFRTIHKCDNFHTPSAKASGLSTKIQICHSRTRHSCKKLNSSRRTQTTKMNFSIQSLSPLWTNSHPQCESIRPNIWKCLFFFWSNENVLKMFVLKYFKLDIIFG